MAGNLRQNGSRAGEILAQPAVHVGTLAALALVLCLARVATEPLDGDPAMYATIAKTIAQSGEWMRLTFNGEPYLAKPPLHFWLNALVFRVLPATAFTAALIPGLLGVADTLLVYGLCRTMFPGWQTAFAAALAFITTPEVVHWSRGVHLETLVTFWVLLGLLCAYRSVTQPSAVLLLGVTAAGGWLAKGPQGLFPAVVAVLLWAREGVLWRRLASLWTLAAIAVVLALTGPWFWARLTEGSGFGRAYFDGQIGRTLFRGGVFLRGPFWYVSKLLRTYWPWLPVAVAGLVLLARRWQSMLGARLWLVYAAVVMLVICLAVGKKSRYLFQLYPALAVAAGVAIAAAAEHRPRLLPLLVVPAAMAALVVAAVGGERTSPAQAAYAREAVQVAAGLDPATRVWLTRRTQHGEPRLEKTLGFYARPLLRTCRARCLEEALPGDLVIARAGEAERLARRLGGEVGERTPTLAVVRFRPRSAAPRDGARGATFR
jgi:4-amino-4-deoxy-L-arabinose transferase-like glycosyltransferase